MRHLKDHPTSPRSRCRTDIGGPSDGTHLTNDAERVDCPACRESMAKQVERRLTAEPFFTFQPGDELHILPPTQPHPHLFPHWVVQRRK